MSSKQQEMASVGFETLLTWKKKCIRNRKGGREKKREAVKGCRKKDNIKKNQTLSIQ